MSSQHHHVDWAATLAGGLGGLGAPFADFASRVVSGVVVGLIVAGITWIANRLQERFARKDGP